MRFSYFILLFFYNYLFGLISSEQNINSQAVNNFVEQINIKTAKGIQSIDKLMVNNNQAKQDFFATEGFDPNDSEKGFGDPFGKILNK